VTSLKKPGGPAGKSDTVSPRPLRYTNRHWDIFSRGRPPPQRSVLVRPSGVIAGGHVCIRREAMKVRRSCHTRARHIWGIGLAVLLVVTATACMSHAEAHAHDLPHPLLCLDAPGALSEGQTLLRQFVASGPLRSFPTYAACIAYFPGMALRHIAGEEAKDHPLLWFLSQLPRERLRTLLAVLHL
jgi:hypothetical protein